jgi:hypothetical protein
MEKMISQKSFNSFTSAAKSLRGELSGTPREIVVEMFNQLDDVDWKNPELRILDPCAGFGTFLREAYIKLKEFHTKDHILNNMLYACEIGSFKPLFLQKKMGLRNIYKGDFLGMKKIDNWPDKFDVIVCNPPYGGGSVGGRGAGGGKSIWHTFVLKSYNLIKDDGTLCFIHPEDWRNAVPGVAKVNGSKKEKELVFSLLTSGKCTSLRMWGNRAFGKDIGVDVDSWVIKNNYCGPCEITYQDGESVIEHLPKDKPIVGLSPSSIAFSILQKTTSEKKNGIFLRKAWSGLKILDENGEIGNYRLAHGSKHLDGNWKLSNLPHIHQNSNKVVVCEIRQPRGKFYSAEDSVGISDHVHYWIVPDEARGKSLEIFAGSKIVNYLRLKTYPLILPFWIWEKFNIDFPNIKSEKQLYDYFNFTESEILEIENYEY